MRLYSESLGAAERAVLLAARATRTEQQNDTLRNLIAEVGIPAVRSVAVRNKCEALVGFALGQEALSLAPADWTASVEQNRIRTESLARTLGEVLTQFAGQDLPAAVIEGANSVFSAGLPLAAYGAGDFDILVSKEHWADAQAVLARLGFEPANRRDRQTVRIEFRRESAQGTQWIEVGCQPFDRKWIPLIYEDRSSVWLERRVVVDHPIAGKVPVLHPDDGMTVAAYHASLHSYVRSPALRLQVDIDRAARHPRLDWNGFAKETRTMGTSTRAFVSLRIASALLGTPVPQEIFEALAPDMRRWEALARLLGTEGVIDDGQRKLVSWKAVRLDQLLHEAGTRDWLRNLALPPTSWMLERFGTGPAWKTHARRYFQASTRWRREVG